MAYITSESVKEIRNQIKALYPAKDGWKFSITRQDYSNVRCAILTAPFELRNNLERTYEGVNHYYIDSNYQDNQPAKEVLTKINNVLNLNNYDNSDSMVDYFDVGHYVTLQIGEWDKPFQVK